LSSLAPAAIQRLKGVPFWPSTCFLLSVLHATVGELVVPLASFAIAVTHWLNGVPVSFDVRLALVLAGPTSEEIGQIASRYDFRVV
jgi:hypothetical protein